MHSNNAFGVKVDLTVLYTKTRSTVPDNRQRTTAGFERHKMDEDFVKKLQIRAETMG
jgi:hypothetical protein